LKSAGAVVLAALLSGCNLVVLSPSGDIAVQQRNLLLQSTVLMLLIIVPVIAFTLYFAWHYRASNEKAHYDPNFHHSTQLEVAIWTAPLIIIIMIGAITWLSTHTLDPYRSVARIEPGRPVPAGVQPLNVEVVALDWKWLFFYPDQGVAVVNELAAPVNVPIAFKITSASVMNSLFIPALAGQVYAMTGMQTQLHAVINHEGDFAGFSANYSGTGFSRMHFTFRGMSQQAFDQWMQKAKASGDRLDRAAYAKLEQPSEAAPVQYFGSVENGLFEAILNMCATQGTMCVSEMHQIDSRGGAGADSEENQQRLEYDTQRVRQGHEMGGATEPATGQPAMPSALPEGSVPRPGEPNVSLPAQQPNTTLGHAMPGAPRGPAPAQLSTRPNPPEQH
jgi:cytochrome o ubiquinol oxidase subunit 2